MSRGSMLGPGDGAAHGFAGDDAPHTKVAIVVTGLGIGGAELMLLRLLEHAHREHFSFRVFSLTSVGEVGLRIGRLGIPVHALGLRRSTFNPLAIATLIRDLKQMRPDVVHTWMYHADLLGGVAARLAGVREIIWGIRNSTLDTDKTKAATRAVARVNARLSRWLPSKILSCSEVARDVHVALGYAPEKITVIPNGFDLSRFRPDPVARVSVRAELAVPASAPLVGLVGRFDPQKNHAGFLQAAALLRQRVPHVRFVLVGPGVDQRNAELVETARVLGLDDAVRWLGQRDDMPRLMASLDVLASSSFGEAFPNVLGEAMACGVPCVVTNAGDSAAIVGDTGRVVALGDMLSLAAAIEEVLLLDESQRAALGSRARQRVTQHFDLGQVVKRYEDFYTATHSRTMARSA